MKWQSKAKWVDVDTGEIVEEENRQNYYEIRKRKSIIIIKIAIDAKRTKEKGVIEWVTECRRRSAKQGSIW